MPAISHTVKKDQSLIDIAVTNYGSSWLDGLLEIIKNNDVSLADDLVSGTSLEIVNVNENDLGLRYLKARNIEVATGNYMAPLPAAPTDLVAVVYSDTENRLTWTDNASNETAYRVMRRVPGGEWEEIAVLPADSTEYIDDLTI